jgi:hypothetical protein
MSWSGLYALFGGDWLVRPYECLFSDGCVTSPDFPTSAAVLTAAQRALGEAACAGLSGYYREACIHDVGLSGSVELVQAYYANTTDLNEIAALLQTPSVDLAVYALNRGARTDLPESTSETPIYRQDALVTHVSGEGEFLLSLRPPRDASATFAAGFPGALDQHLTSEGDLATAVDVHCNQPDPQWSELLGEAWPRYGALQLWSLDPLSGFVAQKVMEFPLSCASDPGRIVASENFSLALDNEGKVWAWGDNQKGQLGTGDNQYSSTPVAADLSALGGVPVTWLAAGRVSALALDAEGRLWEWGSDEWQNTEPTLSPVAVDLTPLGGSGIASIATGERAGIWEYDLILDEENRLWIRGEDEHTDSICYDTDGPAWQQVDLTALGEAKVVRMAAKAYHVLLLDNTGQLWAWGDNQSGQLGDGTTGQSWTLGLDVTKTGSCTPVAVDQSALGGWKAADVAAGYGVSYAIDESGRVWSWGDNFKGQLGDGTSSHEELGARPLPGLVQLPKHYITRIAVGWGNVLALDENGQLWGWGWNQNGELGNGTKGITQPGPMKVDQSALGDAKFVAISTRTHHSLALDDRGRLWAWGANDHGQLGIGTASQTRKLTPVRVDDSALGDDPWRP